MEQLLEAVAFVVLKCFTIFLETMQAINLTWMDILFRGKSVRVAKKKR